MSPPWMPLYIADYRQDTAHLSAAEHGAYLLLIMHYWSAGSLPTEDRQLARIAAMSPSEWKRSRSTIQPFFLDGWKHKRIDAELARTAEVSASYAARASQAAKTRWSKHASSISSSMPEALLEQSLGMPSLPSPSPKKDQIPADAGSPSKEYEFEYGVIRLTKKHFSAWEKANSYLDLRAELISLEPWAREQSNWFCALPGALAKRNRDQKFRVDQAKQGGPQLPLTRAGNPWPEGQM